MDKDTEETLGRLLRRAGLEMAESDRARFIPMLEVFMESLNRLHSIDLAGEQVGGVFRPETDEGGQGGSRNDEERTCRISVFPASTARPRACRSAKSRPWS